MKIAVCTPTNGDVTAEYAYSLAKLMFRTGQARIEFNENIVSPTLELFIRSSSVLPQLRNMLVRDAHTWGANYLLWVDSDQKFPDDALLRLLSLNLPVVGANYPRRVPPYLPTATKLDGTLLETTEESAKAGEIVRAAGVGLGFCLIDMTVLDQLHSQATANRESDIWPLFAVEMVGDGTQVIGEDIFFFRKLRDAGIVVNVDQALSWSIGHVHQRVLTNADAVRSHPAAQAPSSRVIRIKFNS